MFRWYLIHTKPSGEATAQENLERQGYEVYLPRAVRPVRRYGRWREHVVALFPRYLFLGLNEGQQALAPARSTIGVANVVRFGQRYAVVPEMVIRELRMRADPESGLHHLGDGSQLTTGASVRVAAGPFDGLQGIFQSEAGAERVTILLDLLGQVVSTRMSADLIAPSHAT